jgi:hypothetical protein
MSECDIENCQVVNNHEVLRICCEDLNEQVIQLKKELVLAKREGAKQELEKLNVNILTWGVNEQNDTIILEKILIEIDKRLKELEGVNKK